MRLLFIVQGEGRGHLTQALAIRQMVASAGHTVTGVLAGRVRRRELPRFFIEKIGAPVRRFASPGFNTGKDHRALRPFRTLAENVMRAREYREALRQIDTIIDVEKPDLVLTFYEPMAGVYQMLYRPSVPFVAVGHQYMFDHPAYSFAPGGVLDRFAVTQFTRLTAFGAAWKLGLSLYPAEDLPDARLSVIPPLLRREVVDSGATDAGQAVVGSGSTDAALDLADSGSAEAGEGVARSHPAETSRDVVRSTATKATRNAVRSGRTEVMREEFFLVYLLNRGYAAQVIEWHEANPHVRLECFWDHPDADDVVHHDDFLTFHRLHDVKFLDLMTRCRALVSTAGFEALSEALYLGKPVLAVPVEGHYEQQCNAWEVERLGAGVRADRFDLNLLSDFMRDYDPPVDRFRRWVATAEGRVAALLQAVAAGRV